jgi:hypothetical protein
MSTGRNAFATDKVTPKNPNGLSVVFSKPTEYQDNLALVDISGKMNITKNMFLNNLPVSGEIIQAVPVNSSGFYDYAYNGSLGSEPDAQLQIAITIPSEGWQTIGFAKILANGHIYAEADFSAGTGDTYRLLIKP